MFSTLSIIIVSFLGQCHEASQVKQDKCRFKSYTTSHKDVINIKTKTRMAGGISETTKPSFVEVQEQESPTDFEYTAGNDVTKIFSATQRLDLII
jgi:hypothetical protein